MDSEKRVLAWLLCPMNNKALGKSNREIIYYGLIGVVSNIAGYLMYLMITYLGCPPKIAMTILYCVGATVSFLGNRKLTFKHQGHLLGSGIKYIIAHFLGYLLNLTILIVMVDNLGYAHQWVQAVAIFIVAAFLFMALKFFVFPTYDAEIGSNE
jgi:putative flippase GtrA